MFKISLNNSIFQIKRPNVQRFLLVSRKGINKAFTLQLSDVSYYFLYAGFLLAFLGSLSPWFMWSLNKVYVVIASMLIFSSMVISRRLESPIFTRKNYIIPLGVYLLLTIVMHLVNGHNILAYITSLFNAIIFFALFRLHIDGLQRLADFLTKAMALMMCISIPFYVLYLLGFSLPHNHISNDELMYSFENYRFFLLDDRSIELIIPRFHSVFLEPGHLGTACTLLLLTQIGCWRRWHNIVIFITIFLTFSLAAYVLLVIVLFVAAWVRYKAIIGKSIALVVTLTIVAITAMLYNKGNNLVNELIVQRLTINEDGKLEGDNRVTGLFETEYDKFIQSNDILIGREYKLSYFGWGNAGYRVFIYDNGFITLFMVIVFYLALALYSPQKRAKISMLVIAIISFIPRAIPLTYYFILPLYIFAYIGDRHLLNNSTEK